MSTFAETLRALSSKQKSTRGVSLYSRFVNRPLGRVLAASAVRLGIGPNGVTGLSALVTVAGLVVLVLAPPDAWTGVVVWLLLALGFALDSADGQVARITATSGVAGEWLDHVVDAGKMVLVHTAVLVAWFRDDVSTPWLVVPLVYQLVAVVMFSGLTLVTLLKRAHHLAQSGGVRARGDARPPSGWRATAMIPVDYGVLCLVFVLWGATEVFEVAYLVLTVLNAVVLVLFIVKWMRELTALSTR